MPCHRPLIKLIMPRTCSLLPTRRKDVAGILGRPGALMGARAGPPCTARDPRIVLGEWVRENTRSARWTCSVAHRRARARGSRAPVHEMTVRSTAGASATRPPAPPKMLGYPTVGPATRPEPLAIFTLPLNPRLGPESSAAGRLMQWKAYIDLASVADELAQGSKSGCAWRAAWHCCE